VAAAGRACRPARAAAQPQGARRRQEPGALLDAQRAERAVLVGHCMGANVAAQFAARYPARTESAVLIEPMPRDALIGSLAVLKHFKFAFTLAGGAALALNEVGLSRRKLQPMDLEQWDKAVENGEIPLEEFASPLSDLRTTPSAGYFHSVAAIFEPLPSSLACPVLAMISRNSTMTDPARTRAALEKLGNAEILELDAEHWIPTEQPEAMRAALEAWLARMPAPVRF
jgi:esterase